MFMLIIGWYDAIAELNAVNDTPLSIAPNAVNAAIAA
jgi:hypothetical protein